MKIYNDNFYTTTTTTPSRLITPFKHKYCQSIIRLYRDIFLVYDANTYKWCLVRIIVP
eukprot:gnl/Chilomastix_caulleri/2653.p1 GENE.gnl/Chilomastix_caulleri/2653~~gnl/Chilomastix_caulleri/2653.p1  ORF type:complete len:58 (-),score=13.58 gnl/Chilomastix_caulleri/2653:198-371(-)